MKDYHINIFYSDSDKCYIADIPDLPGCSACGTSPAVALNELNIVKELWIKSALKIKKTIPKPKYKPAIYSIA